jgi:hypothetical protein
LALPAGGPGPYDPLVIADADATLVSFLGARLGKGVTVTVETPEVDWAGAKAARLSCFLYRIKEDVTWLDADWRDVRNAEGRMDGRLPPSHHYRLHYLVSAWADSVGAEHRLLGDFMRVCAQTPIVPAEFVGGSLAATTDPVRLWLATPTPESGVDPVDVWSSLGVGARLTLELVVGTVLVAELDKDLAPPAESLTLDMGQYDPERRGGGIGGEPVATERKWTTLRLREKPASELNPPKRPG